MIISNSMPACALMSAAIRCKLLGLMLSSNNSSSVNLKSWYLIGLNPGLVRRGMLYLTHLGNQDYAVS